MSNNSVPRLVATDLDGTIAFYTGVLGMNSVCSQPINYAGSHGQYQARAVRKTGAYSFHFFLP